MTSLGQATLRRTRRSGWTVALTVMAALALLCPIQVAFGWGHEGHEVVALIAEQHMTQDALAKAGNLLDGSAIDGVASWADDYRRDQRETGPWHYIDIPLADSKIDMARECPQGQCVIAQTEHFLAVLKDLEDGNPVPITAAYERHADPVVEPQLEKPGVRLGPGLDCLSECPRCCDQLT